MNRLIFQEVEDLFAKAVGFDEPRRQVFLDQVARDHSREVRDMLERLLARDQSHTRWTDIGSAAVEKRSPKAEPAGKVMDRFRLIERLGVGGHGEVYLADQIEPVQRRVALKMVRTEIAGEQAIERFHAEQQALARMNHPGIARVFEAGLADQGRLFFAMEYVDGLPIDVHCDRSSLAVRDRLKLFLRVCQAVQHAHQRGLIHRDLKPTNILVADRDGEATPVLIDFGIAVATRRGGDDEPAAAARGAGDSVIGTPAYMSPEQAGSSPQDLDTRCDVYALGMVLFELLVGRTPFDVLVAPDAPAAEVRKAIVESPRLSLSELLSRRDVSADTIATLRGTTPRGLRRAVQGDLDAIVARATRRDRDERYPSVEAFAADVRNVLEHRPVSASDDGAWLRARKFVRRHRLIVGASVVALTLMIAAVVGTSLGMVRARKAAAESASVSEFLQRWLTLARAQEKGSTVRFADVLAEGSAMASERFADYPEHEGKVRAILGETYYSLGLYSDAEKELSRAHALLGEALGPNTIEPLAAGLLLAQSRMMLGNKDAAQTLVEDIALRTASEHSKAMVAVQLRAQWMAATLLQRRGKYAEAERRIVELLPRIDAELGRTHQTAFNARTTLTEALGAQAAMSADPARKRALNERVIELLNEIIQVQETLYDDAAAMPRASPAVSLAEALLIAGRRAEARAIIEPLLPAIRERFSASHLLFTNGATVMAILLYADGDEQAAADLTLELLAGIKSARPARSFDVIARTHDALPVLAVAGKVDEGLPMAREHFQTLSEMMGAANPMTVEARLWAARFCDLAGKTDEAGAIYDDLAAGANADLPRLKLFLAGHLARLGRFEEADAALKFVSEATGGEDGQPLNTIVVDELERMHAEVYRAWGREDDARAWNRLARDRRAGK